MNEQALIEELKQPQYAGLSDQEAAGVVNAKMVTIRQPVDSGLLMDACMAAGIWAKLEAANQPGSTDPPASLARTMMERLKQPRPLDFDNPAVQQNVADCIQHGLITQEQQQQLSGLANKVLRWVDVEDIGEVGIGYVINARKAIARGA
jgi:hypothetical protein